MIDEVPTNVNETAVSKIQGMKTRTELNDDGIRAIGDLALRSLHHDWAVAEFRKA